MQDINNSTKEEKQEILNRLLAAWEKVPHMKLAMIIVYSGADYPHHSNEDFIDMIEAYVYPRRTTGE